MPRGSRARFLPNTSPPPFAATHCRISQAAFTIASNLNLAVVISLRQVAFEQDYGLSKRRSKLAIVARGSVMNWEAITAMGSILGGLAILASLVYLSIQVSQAQRIAKLQASQNLNDMFNQSFALIVSSPELARQLHRLELGEEITDAEFVQVRAYLQTQLTAWENAYIHANERIYLEPVEFERGLRAFLRTPGVARAWQLHKSSATENFVQFVDRIYSQQNE